MIGFDKKKLNIVIPLANESATLNQLYQQIVEHTTSFENQMHIRVLFVVDNASTDNTRELVELLEKQDKQIQLVWAPQNRCVVDAYLAGFQTAIDNNADYILEMDGGLSHLPSQIPQFINKLLEGYDCVFGSRFLENTRFDTRLQRFILSKGGALAAYILLGMKFTDATSGFEAFKADVLRKIISKKLVSTGHFWHVEIKFRARNLHYTEVPIHYKNPSTRVTAKSIYEALWGLLVYFSQRIRGYNDG